MAITVDITVKLDGSGQGTLTYTLTAGQDYVYYNAAGLADSATNKLFGYYFRPFVKISTAGVDQITDGYGGSHVAYVDASQLQTWMNNHIRMS